MSQQAVSAIFIQNSARVPISWLPHIFISLKILGPLFLMTFLFLIVHVELFVIFSPVYILLSSSACCVTSRHHSPPPPAPRPLLRKIH
jgi:hypothetical protein